VGHVSAYILATMGVGRVVLGLAPFVAVGLSARLLHLPKAQNTAVARLMARFFGVRDIGLGLIVFYALAHRELLPVAALFNASMDAGDLIAISIPLLRREGIDRSAWTSAWFAGTALLAWLLMFFVVR
jgi:hypothetical protein